MYEIWIDYEEDYYKDDLDYDENEELYWEYLFSIGKEYNYD